MYLKIIATFVLIAWYFLPVYSQQNTFNENLSSSSIKMFDANGKPFVNPNIDIAGSPYFIDGWKYGSVTLNDNTTYSKRQLRVNFQTQQVHYLSENNVEMTLQAGAVKAVVLLDSGKIPFMQYNFQSGFPKIDNQDETFLYKLICNGKIKMLESTRKKIIEDKNEFAGTVNKEFRAYEDYYIYFNTEIVRLKKSQQFFLDMMSDKSKAVEKFIEADNTNFKKTDGIKKLVDYYNSIQ